MQPFNKKYREFRGILQSLILIKKETSEFEVENKLSQVSSSNGSSTDRGSNTTYEILKKKDRLNKKRENNSPHLIKNPSNQLKKIPSVQNMTLPKIK